MAVFQWDEGFVTGLEGVDEQHHGLVDTLNTLIELLTRPTTVNPEEAARVSAQLFHYALTHFDYEESLMREIGVDPRHLEYQQQQHQIFIQEVARKEGNLTEDLAAAKALLNFLGHWIVYHILRCDQSMARQIAAIRSGVPPALAYEEAFRATEHSADPLLHALDAMFEQVMERNRQLLQANETLEMRVADRTRELQEANDRLNHLALTDVLTGLPNRRHALDRLAQYWSEAQRHGTPLTCILVDADGFKQVNDTYGHDAGDIVLKELARALRALIRQEDLLARLGGDEFLILCPQTDLAGAKALAEHLRAQVHALRIQAGQGAWQGSLSLGVAERSPEHLMADSLIGAADSGLYAAKRRGRNQVGIAGD